MWWGGKPPQECNWVRSSAWKIHGSPWAPMRNHGFPWVPMGPMGSHGFPWVPMGPHGFPWVPMGFHGFPWVPMGSHGSPWVPWDPMGFPWGPDGPPMASMENPRMWKIMDFNENHYSVRQNGGSTGSSSMRNVFPLHPVTSKRLESPYGAKQNCLAENQVFQFFCLFIPYTAPIDPL